jgi:CYTH domain-containing protein
LIATRGITVRVRKLIPRYGIANQEYFFTLKVNVGGRVVEIENKLDKRDFGDLWNISLNKLEKLRYLVKNGKLTWELDFFKDYRGETYMAVAEIELPEGQLEPDNLPDFIRTNLLYKVPLTDNRFSNKLMGDARYAADLLNEILKK